MPPRRRVRVVLYAPPDLIMRYLRLSERFDLTRSEVYRIALERGFKPTEASLERAHPSFAARGSRVGDDADPAAGPAAGGSGSSSSALAVFERYATKLVNREDGDFTPEQMRMLLLSHADALGINPGDAAAFVDVIFADLIPLGDADPASADQQVPADQQALPISDPARVDLD